MKDTKKEIEKMANICEAEKNTWSTHRQGFCYAQAEALSKSGYGNVKQAVKEFVEELKHRCADRLKVCDEMSKAAKSYDATLEFIGRRKECGYIKIIIDNLFKELYGEDKQ